MPPSKEDKPGKPTKRRMVKAGRKRGKGVKERKDVGGGEKEKEPRGIGLTVTDVDSSSEMKAEPRKTKD